MKLQRLFVEHSAWAARGCRWLLIVAGLVTLAFPGFGRELEGKLISVDENGKRQPLGGVEIRLAEASVTTQTQPGGGFRLAVPESLRAGTLLHLVVEQPGRVVVSPSRGRVWIPFSGTLSAVDVVLAPKGSKRLWTDDQMRLLVLDAARASVRSRPATAEWRELQFVRVFGAWAENHGFAPEDVVQEVERWSRVGVERATTSRDRGIAQLAQRRFDAASGDFDRAVAALLKELEPLTRRDPKWQSKKALLDFRIAETLRLAAVAAHLAEDFAGAAARLSEATTRGARFLDAEERVRIQNDLGNALAERGIRTEGEAAVGLLAEAESTLRSALDSVSLDSVSLDRRSLDSVSLDRGPGFQSAVRNNLGMTLQAQATRVSGEASSDLLAEAESMFRLALEDRPREDQPIDWGLTQQSLGAVLQRRAAHAGSQEGLKPLEGAIHAFRQAVETLPRDALPRLWSSAQNNLGGALLNLAAQSDDTRSVEILGQAVSAFRAALDGFGTQHSAGEWATTQITLGNVLQEQGYRAAGEASRQAFAQAIAAYRAGLEVFTYEQHPKLWAATINNLGTVLEALGSRTEGEAGDKLLDSAAAAHQSALQVFTREALPRDWGTTQSHLGRVYHSQAERAGPEAAARLCAGAITAYRAALEVFDRVRDPDLWRIARTGEATALDDGGRPDEAAVRYREVLAETPADRELTLRLVELYHDELHDYPKALGLMTSWLQQVPDDTLAAIRSIEPLFASGRAQETTFLARHLRTRIDATSELQVVLRGYEVASLLAQQNLEETSTALRELRLLIDARADDWQPSWTFSGTRHYVIHASGLSNSRAINRLFEALEEPGREDVLKNLKPIEEGIRRGLAQLESSG